MLRRLFYIVLLAVLIVLALAWVFRVSLFQYILSTTLDAKVNVEKVELKWGSLTLSNLNIASNDELPFSFQAKHVIATYTLQTIFHSPHRIEQLEIDGGTLVLPPVAALSRKISKFFSSSSKDTPPTVQVKRLVINDFHVGYSLNGKKAQLKLISHAEFERESFLSAANLAALFSQIFLHIADEATLNLPKILKNPTDSTYFKEMKEKFFDTTNTVNKKAQGLWKKLKGHFSS